jgi:iron complex transport system substrate-binding protein
MGRARLLSGPALLLLFISLASGCGEDGVPAVEDAPSMSPEGEVVVTDQAGHTLRLLEPPTRIISLVPAATGVILALDEGERLVGRTDYDEQRELEPLPSVGGGLHPSLERLISLEPDLVIRFEGDQDRATPETLDRIGIAHLAVRPDRIQDIRDMVRILATTLDRDGRGEALLRQMEHELDEVRDRVRDEPRPQVVFILGGDPPWLVGPETFLHELLEIAGGDNAMADLGGPLYAPVSVEEIAQREVDVILVMEGARVPSALQQLPMVRVPDGVQSPGVGLGESARGISRLLHPDRWP